MKKVFLLIALVISYFVNAQGEADNWYFGNNAGLTFSSGTPLPLNDGQLDTIEGCATISNNTGDLLFYTDGITVWDKTHNIMLNGSGLLGNPSSSQSAIIVPKPSDPNIYYIFTVDANVGLNGFNYSEVDLSLNSGNGAVTANKNINLLGASTEKISAISHDNNNDFWVITHGWVSADFYAYKVSDTGVDTTPIISTVGQVHDGDSSFSIGYLKFSPDGKRLALAKTFAPNFVEVFDFDTATGNVANAKLISNVFFNDAGPYGVEFSPNNNLLYISDINFSSNTSKIHQFDISLTTATDIINSDQVIYNGSSNLGALQLAIDQKIYVAVSTSSTISVINNPDVIGTSANYSHNSISLGSRFSTFGLPPFIQSFFSVGIKVENLCFGDFTSFEVNSTETIDSIVWDFGDGNISALETPTHQYLASGNYTVSVTVTSGADVKITTSEIVISDVPTAQPVSDYILCDALDDDLEVFDLTTKNNEAFGGQSTTVFDVAYFATMADASLHENILPNTYQNTSNPQEIFVKIFNKDNSDCYDITSFNLIVEDIPIAHSVSNQIFCDDASNDGVKLIDLNLFNSSVLMGQNASEYNVSYYLSQTNAENATPDITDVTNFEINTNQQTIYVRVENILNQNCYAITSFTIQLSQYFSANQAGDFYVCDDPSNDGYEFFDLTLQNDQIIAGQTGNFNISFHSSQNNALTNSAPIIGLYENQSIQEEIFYRIENANNTNCFQIASFFIGVVENPELEIADDWTICSGESLTLEADAGFDSYLWSTGETTQSIIVNSLGSYEVTVTKIYNTTPITTCSSTKTINVLESNEANLIDVNIVDWSVNDNTITVFVEGIGDYEYSLDGLNYQDSNVFYNLTSKDYVVYVRDKNGCGVVTKDVFLLFYPFVFTPNDDGYNDYWQINFSEKEPDLEIFIFDRYGKLLKQISPTSRGWNGTYNGTPMPTNDYWFLVKRPKLGKEYKGHFTLKR